MIKLTPFLLFDGNCAEAMTFYHQCLGGELTLTKLSDTPMKDQYPKEKHGRLINAHLKKRRRRNLRFRLDGIPDVGTAGGYQCRHIRFSGSLRRDKNNF